MADRVKFNADCLAIFRKVTTANGTAFSNININGINVIFSTKYIHIICITCCNITK